MDEHGAGVFSDFAICRRSSPCSPTNSLAGARRACAPEHLSWAVADKLSISPLNEARLVLNPLTGTWMPPDLMIFLLLVAKIEGRKPIQNGLASLGFHF